MNILHFTTQSRTAKFMAIATAMVLSMGILTPVYAQSTSELSVSDAWLRASAPMQVNGAGYAAIQNKSAKADRLLSASADVAERVEMHTIITENGVAQMRQVTGINMPAGGTVNLAPGGFHIMFVKLKQPFVQGKTVPIKFTFEQAGDVMVNFEVKPITSQQGFNWPCWSFYAKHEALIYRDPNKAEPTLISVEPSSMAISKSPLIPIDKRSNETPSMPWACIWSRNTRNLTKHARTA
jgi:periplasmic copper chaperone A